MDDKLLNVYIDAELHSPEEIYHFISEHAASDDQKLETMIKQGLRTRALAGNIQIAEDVLLPHIESSDLTETRVMIIKLKAPIAGWSKDIGRVKLLIVILLAEKETKEIKQAIAEFMRKIADEKYLEKLLNANNKEAINDLVNIGRKSL
ncbi:MAG: PTS sugar transporter subunit IIA [Enterococcaceae bacterium]|jgi:PTS system nitrogen regulatory IIA component|nr:PTS sugar transporter subunit IIA [Enterococcaceae bacterium]MCI1919765.1 PTS sugar transporter subunit IIA [Enterococcaceae bacterium]